MDEGCSLHAEADACKVRKRVSTVSSSHKGAGLMCLSHTGWGRERTDSTRMGIGIIAVVRRLRVRLEGLVSSHYQDRRGKREGSLRCLLRRIPARDLAVLSTINMKGFLSQ